MNFDESVDRVISHESAALEGFYDRLLERYPEYRPLFQDTNLAAQTAMLTMALVAVKQAPEFRNAAQQYLRVLGARHHARHIPKEAYSHFVAVLLDQISAFHGDSWNDALAEQWTTGLQSAVRVMLEGSQVTREP